MLFTPLGESLPIIGEFNHTLLGAFLFIQKRGSVKMSCVAAVRTALNNSGAEF